jgi:MFS family permease
MPTRPTRKALRNPVRLLTVHSGLVTAAEQVAGIFFAVYLVRAGLSLAMTFLALAAVLGVRFGLRFLVLFLVPKLGLRRSLALGTIVRALQFAPLAYAGQPLWLAVWIALSALADALYWPLYHAAIAASGAPESRGRQLGALEAIRSLAGIVGPALGGWLMTASGPLTVFALGAMLQLGALWPLLVMPELESGPIPTAAASLRGDRLGFLIFVSDGALQIGWSFVWSLALFTTLGSSFESYGGAMALSGLVAAIVGVAAGRFLDEGHGGRLLTAVTIVMIAGIAARILAIGDGPAAVLVNAFSVVAVALYIPVVMNTMYNRAHRLGPLSFHFFTESGWDVGGILGCGLAALVASLGISLGYAMLPSFLAMLAIRRFVTRAEREAARLQPAVPAAA